MMNQTMGRKIDVLEHALVDSAVLYNTINLTQNVIPGHVWCRQNGELYNLNEKIHFPENAHYSDMVKYWSDKVMDSRENFVHFFSRDYLLQSFQEGLSHVSHRHWTVSCDGIHSLYVEHHIIMYADEVTGDVCAVTYAIDLTPKYKEEQYQKQLENKQRELEVALEDAKLARKGREAQQALSAIGDILGNLVAFDHVTNVQELREELPALMASLGTYSKSDRAYIFGWASEEKQILRMTGEWVREGVMPTMDIMQDVHMADLPHWAPKLRRGEPIISLDWEAEKEKAPEEYAVFDGQDIHSLVVIPAFTAGKFNGYIGLDNPSLDMMDTSVSVLTSVARYIGGLKSNLLLVDALEAKQASLEQSLQKLNQEKEILNALSIDCTSVYYCDLDTDVMETLKCEAGTNMGAFEKDIMTGLHSYAFRLKQYYDNFVVKESAPDFMEKMSAANLKSYLADHDRFVYRFRVQTNPAGKSCFEAQIVRLKETEGFKVVMGYRYIDDILMEQEKQQIRLENALAEARFNSELVGTISKFYWLIYQMNLQDGTYEEISSGEDMHRLTGKHGNTQEVFHQAVETVVNKEYHEKMKAFLDMSTLAERLNQAKQESDAEAIAAEYQAKDGSWHLARFVVKNRDDQGRPIHVLYIVRQIDTEKKMEAEYKQKLWETAQEARRANMAKTDFLRRMSHDIRTPINGIRGLLTMADHFTDDMEKQKEYRDKMKNVTGYLLDLVNSVLDMNKLESGNVILEHKPFDVCELLQDVRNIIEPQAKEKGIKLIRDKGGIQHHHLLGSPVHLRQILQNVASNAVKYSPVGSQIHLTTCEKEYKDGKALFQMTCTDNGQGMSEEFLKKAFEPFAQENQDARTTYTGTGLGLAITKQLVELLGGTITLDSKLHEGTTVTILLPLDVDLSKEVPKEIEKKPDHVCLKGRKVLLVEDNELNMEIAKFILEYRGLDVTTAMNGQEAVGLFAQSEEGFFDVVLMDIMMPVMGGLEATRTIRRMERSDAKTVPIFAMTANAFLEDQKRSRDAGMNEHLTKPLKEEVLFETIAKYLR
ncbi:MAG TPA: hybrid sensor histidine kinase/response regulator [Dialister sp.]|nr:hybrid sensor histidine kinase/response regulator [Dialister sp.]